MEKKKILVIAPHADDEVLGCGGYLLHHRDLGDAEAHIVIGSIGGSDVRQDYDIRFAEFMDVCNVLDAQGYVLTQGEDARLDQHSSFDLTTRLDKIIDTFRPDEIFVNYRSLHQDHMKMYDCAMAACRLREGYSPKMIALYEYPFSTSHVGSIGGGFMYHDISSYIDSKVELFERYASQIRQSPSPLNRDGIMALARIRGVECGRDYAEKFYIQKIIY